MPATDKLRARRFCKMSLLNYLAIRIANTRTGRRHAREERDHALEHEARFRGAYASLNGVQDAAQASRVSKAWLRNLVNDGMAEIEAQHRIDKDSGYAQTFGKTAGFCEAFGAWRALKDIDEAMRWGSL